MPILVTNDDGVFSEGIQRLAEALRPLGQVTIVAPVQESSAIGHALTLARPLRLEQVSDGVFSVDGTPTDCVNIAVTRVLPGLPALVVSGINKGYNLGDDVTYSGTVAGALEGALLGVPGIAVSLERILRRLRLRSAGCRGRRAGRGGAGVRAAAADVPECQRPSHGDPGVPRDGAGTPQSRDEGPAVDRSARAGRTTGSRRGRAPGPPIRARTTTPSRKASCRSARCTWT